MCLFPPSNDPIRDAADTAAWLDEHAALVHQWYDFSPGHRTQQVLHLITFGAHIDPDFGRNYVRVGEKLTPSRRRKIAQRDKKVSLLANETTERLLAQVSPALIQQDLHNRQSFRAVALSTSPEDLREILSEAFSFGDLSFGCLDGGYVEEIDDETILFTWEEAIECEGGVTSRYWFAELYGGDTSP